MFAQPWRVPVLAAPLALAACLMPMPASDPEAARLLAQIDDSSARFHTALAAMPAPQCGFEQNRNFYDELEGSSAALRSRLTENRAAAAAQRAGDALLRLAGRMRASHQAASARSDDPHGVCMAPGAIALNAEALARATRAIAATTLAEGAR